MLPREELLTLTAAVVAPNNLVEKLVRPEDLVENQLDVVADVPIQVDVDTTIVGEELVNQDEPLVQHRKIGALASAPRIAIGVLLEDARGFRHRLITDGDLQLEV